MAGTLVVQYTSSQCSGPCVANGVGQYIGYDGLCARANARLRGTSSSHEPEAGQHRAFYNNRFYANMIGRGPCMLFVIRLTMTSLREEKIRLAWKRKRLSKAPRLDRGRQTSRRAKASTGIQAEEFRSKAEEGRLEACHYATDAAEANSLLSASRDAYVSVFEKRPRRVQRVADCCNIPLSLQGSPVPPLSV